MTTPTNIAGSGPLAIAECRESDRVFSDDPIGDGFRPAGLQIDHRIIEVTITGKLGGGLFHDLKMHFDAGAEEIHDPGSNEESVKVHFEIVKKATSKLSCDGYFD